MFKYFYTKTYSLKTYIYQSFLIIIHTNIVKVQEYWTKYYLKKFIGVLSNYKHSTELKF